MQPKNKDARFQFAVKDSQMGLDGARFACDGWVSVIGQNGKTVTVEDYRIDDANK